MGLQTCFSGGTNIGGHKGRANHIQYLPDWICSLEQTSEPRGKLLKEERQGTERPGFLGYSEAKILGFGHFLWDYFSYLLFVMIWFIIEHPVGPILNKPPRVSPRTPMRCAVWGSQWNAEGSLDIDGCGFIFLYLREEGGYWGTWINKVILENIGTETSMKNPCDLTLNQGKGERVDVGGSLRGELSTYSPCLWEGNILGDLTDYNKIVMIFLIDKVNWGRELIVMGTEKGKALCWVRAATRLLVGKVPKAGLRLSTGKKQNQ